MKNEQQQMNRQTYRNQSAKYLCSSVFICGFISFFLISPTWAQNRQTNNYQITVNSNQDGAVQADQVLTLREAIEIVNGTLSLEQLSTAERSQVQLNNQSVSIIQFDLQPGSTTIYLQTVLPPIINPDLIIDGTTNPGYDPNQSATAEIEIPIPVVAITPSENQEIFQGLTIVTDNVTVKGLSIYGFNGQHDKTVVTLPADIFISNTLPPNSPYKLNSQKQPPQNIIIENNWLGLPTDEQMPQTTSAFGVSVFNSLGTIIRRNRIYYHDGSGIITSMQAQNLAIIENIIVGNGMAGMPDAIRLEGNIDQTQIESNLLCGNDGSGVFLLKPQGTAKISNNEIKFNGRRLRRAAVFLTGSNHQVSNNQIGYQTGSGIAVAAYPESIKNLLDNNTFTALEGLSIDLITRDHIDVRDWQNGDGANPKRDTQNRRLDTGNAGINAPKFLSEEFYLFDGKVNLDGVADPGANITIYQVKEGGNNYGPLSQPLTTVIADEEGKFGLTLTDVQPGERISAIATLPDYGTSEPAANAVIRTVEGGIQPLPTQSARLVPRCTTEPIVIQPEETPPPEVIRLKVPRNVHFALDKSNISQESAVILDQVAAVLREYPFIVIELQGHTDRRASDEYNLALGRRRALAVREYLVRQGIGSERITIRSFGESQLREPGNSIVDHALNRRVEIIFQDIRGVDITFEDQETDLQLER